MDYERQPTAEDIRKARLAREQRLRNLNATGGNSILRTTTTTTRASSDDDGFSVIGITTAAALADSDTPYRESGYTSPSSWGSDSSSSSSSSDD